MTNVRRPIHLQLRPDSLTFSSAQAAAATTPIGNLQARQQLNKSAALQTNNTGQSMGQDTLPNQILPHLYVGNQEQTNKETLNRLNIGYILSLGLLPIITNSNSPTSPTTTTSNGRAGTPTNNQTILLPNENTSIDFKVRIRTSSSSSLSNTDSSIITSTNNNVSSTTPSPIRSSVAKSTSTNELQQQQLHQRDENKGVRSVRSIYCKCINISDNSNQDLIKFFDEAYQFIEEARRKKCNILVHCLAGISRSPTVAIAYLMRLNSLRLQDAYKLVKKCRPQIDPNLSFMGQLMLYDETLRQIRDTNTTNGNDNNNEHHHSSINNSNTNSCNRQQRQQQQHQQQQNSTHHNCFCDRLRDH